MKASAFCYAEAFTVDGLATHASHTSDAMRPVTPSRR
jgi:hypothetical protein